MKAKSKPRHPRSIKTAQSSAIENRIRCAPISCMSNAAALMASPWMTGFKRKPRY